MEAWSVHQLYSQARDKLGKTSADSLQRYATRLINGGVPVIFSLRHLSELTEVPYQDLEDTINRKREAANYRMYAVRKRAGGRRFIHAVSKKLLAVQTFINACVLQMVRPHACSFAFHPSGGIRNCAARHCGACWLFQFDLKDFFYSVTEAAVFRTFRDMGYRTLLAFELARLCTTTRLPRCVDQKILRLSRKRQWRLLVKMPHRSEHGQSRLGVLPQGAPTSPMLSNFAARAMDERLSALADEMGLVYTRYADDLTFSCCALPDAVSIGGLRRRIIHSIRKSGFIENTKKTRIAGPGSKKLVLGLLVDGEKPRISRETYKRIERLLYASKTFGIPATAEYEGFDSAYGFANHLRGLLAFVNDVDPERRDKFQTIFDHVDMPEGL